MSGGLALIACVGRQSLDRCLLLSGAVTQHGGTVVLLTYTPGLALRHAFFGMEVVVRRDDSLDQELARLESVALSRGAGAILLDDERFDDRHAAAVRVLSEQLPIARYGPQLAGGAAGELAIDPFDCRAGADAGPLQAFGCYGLSYLPLHPGLRPLRERRGADSDEGPEVRRVTLAFPARSAGVALTLRVLEALSIWRPVLQVSLLVDLEASPEERAGIERAMARSRHQVTLRPRGQGPQLGEGLLCDLAIVGDAGDAGIAAYLGTPTLVLSLTEADARRAEALAQAGVAVHLPALRGIGEEALPGALLSDMLWNLCADHGRRAGLAAAAHRAIDGHGAERIAGALFDLSQTRGGRARGGW